MLSRVVELTWPERREASFLKVSEASWPQAPNDSTTRGMQLQPSSAQIPELACIFRCSVAKAAEPAVCPDARCREGCYKNLIFLNVDVGFLDSN